uniref:Uncharacterized protein n=1 Tax=Alexandrium catenella TaxID=2925 RepID=A0A7S1WHF7_ALECA|mmetsp:Transcript_6179/g.16495  ORF Transcript_6179/g.16495 Transcript_6179/m.16495 type:complete len:200 (+) Transcript_6179:82-681(+)
MGSLLSKVEERQRVAALDSKLADVKQAKKTRDLDLSLRIASTRDRLCFVAGYYAFVAFMSCCRHLSMHRRGIHFNFDNFFLPLRVTVICLPPFVFGYQLDLALSPRTVFGLPIGGKANRISEEAERIRQGSVHHWFEKSWLPEVDDSTLAIHRPICLPPTFEAAYARERARTEEARAARGLPSEKPWAFFEEACTAKVE